MSERHGASILWSPSKRVCVRTYTMDNVFGFDVLDVESRAYWRAQEYFGHPVALKLIGASFRDVDPSDKSLAKLNPEGLPYCARVTVGVVES